MKKHFFFASFLAVFLLSSTSNILAQTSVYSGAYVYNEGWLNNANEYQQITNFVADAQKDVSIINVFIAWCTSGTSPNVPFSSATNALNFIRGRGSIPLLTWEPRNPSSNVIQSFTLPNITNGIYDSFITEWAAAAKNWGHPFFLRFAHEMNGDWYPWCASISANGNSAAGYVQAWRHVHDLFVAAGATNVTWVWCVNFVENMPTPIANVYPGDNYVDWISLDGYCRKPYTNDFSVLASTTMTQLTTLAPGKPVMVAETGCQQTNYPTDFKAQWFRNALTNYLPMAQPRIKAWVYFNGTNASDGNDWRITVPANAAAGYEQGIGLSYYDTNQYGLISTSPIQPLLNDAMATDTMPPFVSIVSPATDQVTNGTEVNFVALASDKSGVIKVVFSVNGIVQQTDNSPPYQCSWAVPYQGVMSYTVTATAYDNAGNSVVSTIQVVSQGPAITNILQTVTQTTGMDWNSISWGTPPSVPASTYNYETPGAFAVRTPNSITPAAFAGNGLQVDSGGILYLKNGGETSGNAATVNLLLNGGMMEFHGGFAPNGPAVAGTLQVLADSIITTDQTGANTADIWVQSPISGSGNLTVNMNNTGNSVLLSGNNSAYTGNWTNSSNLGNIVILSGSANALGAGSVTLLHSGCGLVFNSTNNLAVSNIISGLGLVIKENTNTVTLNGNNTFTGSLQIRDGILQPGANGSIGSATTIQLFSGAILDVAAGSGGFAVGNSQTLAGIGSVVGNVIVNGAISPGPLGTLNFANHLVLSGTTVMELNRDNTPDADLISAEVLAFGGTLVVTNVGSALQAGDSFQLFSGAIIGAFAVTNLPALSSTNLFWDASKLNSQGILSVSLKPPPAPTILPPSWNGTNLTLQFDSRAGFSYVLQATPLLSPANWVDVQTNSGGGTLAFVLPVNPTNAQQFFRIVVR